MLRSLTAPPHCKIKKIFLIDKIKTKKYPKKGGLLGDHLLISQAAAVKAAAVKATPITLSERERRIVNGLEG